MRESRSSGGRWLWLNAWARRRPSPCDADAGDDALAAGSYPRGSGDDRGGVRAGEGGGRRRGAPPRVQQLPVADVDVDRTTAERSRPWMKGSSSRSAQARRLSGVAQGHAVGRPTELGDWRRRSASTRIGRAGRGGGRRAARGDPSNQLALIAFLRGRLDEARRSRAARARPGGEPRAASRGLRLPDRGCDRARAGTRGRGAGAVPYRRGTVTWVHARAGAGAVLRAGAAAPVRKGDRG